ncbi:MAG: phosphoribosylglycinamide formyltransferase [Pseudomonadota bacterium]
MTPRVAIFISGGGSNMRALVTAMAQDALAEPAVILSNRADAGGIAWARGQGIATAVVDHKPYGADRAAFEAAISAALAPHRPDVICLAGFMRVLTAGFVAPWQGQMLNIHPSLLPLYRGLNTHQRALDAGDTAHGCTVHLVTPELDEGPILGQARIGIRPGDTADSLAARVLEKEHILYPAVLRRFLQGDLSRLTL